MSETADYQKTLNLPQTNFSMRAGLAQKEPQYLKNWEELGLWNKLKENFKGKKPFILHDGPPYANGNIHIGHAFNKILKDFIIKSKTMQGFDSIYVPGWDCHGLPIEHALFKKLKKKKSEVDTVEFRKQAHDFAMKFVDIQREEFKRLGILGEWDKPYLTLNKDYESWILKSLARLNDKGYLYRGLKPVNWCFECETALAEAEVEYENHTSPSVYVKFNVQNSSLIEGLPNKPLKLLIWTTTPWTLIANVAVAVHPHFKYSFVEQDNEIIIVEQTLMAKVFEKSGVALGTVIKEVEGQELSVLTYDHPFGNLESCRVVSADYVTKEDGTGLVHTAPGHGQDDFESGKKYDLPVIMPVNDRGVYTKDAGKYEGQFVFKANKTIIAELTENGSLFATEDIAHSYPHCWRCKKPIIFRATKQWFLKVDHKDLRNTLIKTIKSDVEWIPASGQERIMSMVEGRPDWCLSRQRHWGVPIPAVKLKGSQEYRLYNEVIEKFAEITESEGTNAWFERDINDFIPKGFKDPETGESEFEKTFDILDVWFDSGVSHQAVVKGMMKREVPVEMYLEGSDQHRGWFQSSLIPAVAIEGIAPYKSVLTHGFVVDGDGRKMSKSMGNVMAPQDIIGQSGADILRLWVASSSYNEDVRISKEILDRLVDAYRKIRNTFRYLLGNLHEFNPDSDLVKYEDMQKIDQWAMNELAKVIDGAKDGYNHYEFGKVYKLFYSFCNESLSSFYLDILKDRLYTSAQKSPERLSAQSALYHILNHSIRLLAPLLVFTSEEIFKAMPVGQDHKDVESVHLLQWLDTPEDWHNEALENEFDLLVRLRPFVLKALEDKRRDGEIGSSLEAKLIFQTASDRDFDYLNGKLDELPASFIVSQVVVDKVETVKQPLSEEFGKTQIDIVSADGVKCSRCWNFKEDVGGDADHSTLCARCTSIVKEIG